MGTSLECPPMGNSALQEKLAIHVLSSSSKKTEDNFLPSFEAALKLGLGVSFLEQQSFFLPHCTG